MSKIIDCVTFFNENFIFDLRYNILNDYVDYFIICESLFDHKGNKKKINFNNNQKFNQKKIKHLILERPFPENTNSWEKQAIQREFILKNLNFADAEDYIFFSDPDEIPNPDTLISFDLKKKYGIFLQKSFAYKFNIYNPHESPWEGTRVCKKKNLESIDFMRQKVKSKNIEYNFLRIDKEKNIQLYKDAGWHFNNLLSVSDISLKLKTFAHSEFTDSKFSSINVIEDKIKSRVDLFGRGHQYKLVEFDKSYPNYLINNIDKYKFFIES